MLETFLARTISTACRAGSKSGRLLPRRQDLPVELSHQPRRPRREALERQTGGELAARIDPRRTLNRGLQPFSRTMSQRASSESGSRSGVGVTNFGHQQLFVLRRGGQDDVVLIERVVGKIHLCDQAIELSGDIEMDVRGTHDVARGITAGLDGLEAITALGIGEQLCVALEIRIERRRDCCRPDACSARARSPARFRYARPSPARHRHSARGP